MMKRISLMVAMLVAMVTGLGSTAVTATADTVTPMLENCDHYSGGGIGAFVDGVYMTAGGTRIATVQLCHQGSLYWAYVVFHSTMPSGKWGNAILQIRRNGGSVISNWTCDGHPDGPPNGGNNYVRPGQTRCWTPKVALDITRDFVRAGGFRANAPHPTGSWDASAYTAWH